MRFSDDTWHTGATVSEEGEKQMLIVEEVSSFICIQQGMRLVPKKSLVYQLPSLELWAATQK